MGGKKVTIEVVNSFSPFQELRIRSFFQDMHELCILVGPTYLPG